jgi:hypothetical protein
VKCSSDKVPLLTLSTKRAVYDLDPPYQRESGVWSQAKKQLFIDSLLNGFDVPKIYVHELARSRRFEYAVIDGKQRIGAVLEFFDDGFALDPATFQVATAPKDLRAALRKALPRGGDLYTDLSDAWAAELQGRSLDFVVVSDANEDDIEELFSRLNNGEPLTAAEKRNAMGGNMTALIRDVGDHQFFKSRVKFSNRRLQHLEVAAKFVLVENSRLRGGDIWVDMKSRYLNDLVEKNKSLSAADRTRLFDRVNRGLGPMMQVFANHDPLLSKQAYPPMYYLFLTVLREHYGHRQLWAKVQDFLPKFEVLRQDNLKLSEDKRDPVLTEYGRLIQQGTNDRSSLKARVDVLVRHFLEHHPDVDLLDTKRGFTDEERYVIWIRAGRECEECATSLPELSDMEADHELQWRFSGKTSLDNARALCAPCNHKLARTMSRRKSP